MVERPVGNPWEIPQHGKHAFIVTIYRDENHDAGNPVSFDHILFYINLYPILKNHQKQPVRTILPLNSWFQSSRLLGELTAQRTTNGLDLHGFQVSFKTPLKSFGHPDPGMSYPNHGSKRPHTYFRCKKGKLMDKRYLIYSIDIYHRSNR